MAKEKKIIAPNEATFGRWLLVLLVGIAPGLILGMPASAIATYKDFTIVGIPSVTFFTVLTFVPLFWCLVFSIKRVGKTSLKDFVFGVGKAINKKECLIVLGLEVLGFALHCVPSIINGDIRANHVNIGEYAFLLLFSLALLWMQTSAEELVYRGILIRWTCKNDVRYTAKSILGGFVFALLFALSHVTNPEVKSQTGLNIVWIMMAYLIPGLIYHFASLHFGSLMPGLILHFCNNFFLTTVINAEVVALPTKTLFVETATTGAGLNTMLVTILHHLPIIVYMIVTGIMRKKKAAAAAA